MPDNISPVIRPECKDHIHVMTTLARNTTALEGYGREVEVMRETMDRHHAEYREDMRDIKNLLAARISNGNGIQITAGNTAQNQQPAAGSDSANWAKLWVSLLMIACIVVTAYVYKFVPHPPQPAPTVEARP